jgi:hypothetical protein
LRENLETIVPPTMPAAHHSKSVDPVGNAFSH